MNERNKQANLTLSWGAVGKIVISVILVWVLYMTKDILIWFVFALIIGILFNYIIDMLGKKRVPRIVSATILYMAVFALLSFFIYKTAPMFLNESKDFAQNFPTYLERISPFFEKLGIDIFRSTESFIATLQNSLGSAGDSIVGALFSIFGGAASTILVLAMSFFISLEKNFVERVLAAFAPTDSKESLFVLWGKAKQKVSGWFITRLIGVLFVGAATYIMLRVLGVEYALTLSIVAGLFDLVPIIGPTAAGLGLFFFISLTSLPQAVFALVAFAIIQLLENNLLFPMLFKKFTGMSPVLVLIALAIGGRMWGIAGAILAIPLAGVVFEVLKDYLAKLRKDKDQGQSHHNELAEVADQIL